MPTIIGSYVIDVPASAEWALGPVFKKGESVRVRAGGTVAFVPDGSAVFPTPTNVYQHDTFTGSAYTALEDHDGELHCPWERDYTVSWPNQALLSGSGTVFRSAYNPNFGSDWGNGGEHFTRTYTVPVSDYVVEAVFHWLGDYGGTGTPVDWPTGSGGTADADPTPPEGFGGLPTPGGVGGGGGGTPTGYITANGRDINVSGIDNNPAADAYDDIANIYARLTSSFQGYGLSYNHTTGDWFVSRVTIGGVGTPAVLGSFTAPLAAGGSHGMLVVNGTSVEAWIDGARRIVATDATYDGGGFTGLRFDGGSSPIRGMHLSEYKVHDGIPIYGGASAYAFPEGAYPPDYPSSHAYLPLEVLQPEEWTGSALVATGRPPLSLAMLVLPDGSTPTFGETVGCVSPRRETTFDAESDLGALDPNAFYRLWFVVNDGLTDFTDNSGGYTVLIDRLSNITMANPLVSLISPRFGLQSSLATRIAVARMLGCIADKGFSIKPDQQWEESGIAGFGYQTDSTLIYDVSSGDVTLNLDTLDTGYVLYSVFGGETVTTLASGVYQHDFEFGPFTQAVPPAYSVQTPTEAGDLAQATLDLIFNGLKIGTDPTKRPTASSSFLAGKLSLTGDTDMPTITAGANAVQVVTVNGVPTSGTFVLLDHTRPSAVINTTDAASAVQTAVRTLGGDYALATVSGSAGAWTITSPSGKRLAALVANYTDAGGTSTLVGGTAPTVTVAVTNPGGFKIGSGALCGAQSWTVKVAASWAAMENAPISLTENWSANVTVGERYVRKWIQGAPGLFTYNQKDGKDIVDTLELEMALVDPVRTFINASRSGQRLCTRLKSVGAQIASTGINRSLTIDMDGQAKWPDNSDSDNVRSVKIDFRALYNLATGQMLRVSIVNEIPSYATN